MTLRPTASLGLAALLGCLPVSTEFNNPLEGYQYYSELPMMPAASHQTMCTSTESSGTVRCWGARGRPWSGSLLPETIPNLSGLNGLAVSDSAVCAMGPTEVWCAGSNAIGELGTPPADSDDGSAREVDVSELEQLRSLRAGVATTCALGGNSDNSGRLICWGDTMYQLFQGLQDSDDRSPFLLAPQIDNQPLDIREFDVGEHHICAIVSNPMRIVCWGNLPGLPSAGLDQPTDPRQVTELDSAQAVNAVTLCTGTQHTCAIVNDPEDNLTPSVHCWGDNTYGQAQPSNPGDKVAAQKIGLTNVNALYCGSNHTCARGVDNQTVYCWGDNSKGQLGGALNEETSIAQATVLPSELVIHSLTLGLDFTCALGIPDDDSPLLCWGSNEHGQLGTGDTTDRTERAGVVDFFHDAERTW